jgi:hypothetical protein
MSTQTVFNPGSLVYARGREWVVLPQSDKDTLYYAPCPALIPSHQDLLPA